MWICYLSAKGNYCYQLIILFIYKKQYYFIKIALIVIFMFAGDGQTILQFRFYFEMSCLVFIIHFSVHTFVSDFFQNEIVTMEINMIATLNMLTQFLKGYFYANSVLYFHHWKNPG